MKKQFIRVAAVGDALVPDYDALEQGVKRFVGRKMKPRERDFKPGDTILTNTDGCDFPSTGKAQTVPYRHEYRMHVLAGELTAADHASAVICGVHSVRSRR